MKITAKDILQSIPTSETWKQDLVGQFDTLDPDKKDELVTFLWDYYDQLFKLTLEKNVKIALENNKRNGPDGSFAKRANLETEKEMEAKMLQHINQDELQSVRSKISNIINANKVN